MFFCVVSLCMLFSANIFSSILLAVWVAWLYGSISGFFYLRYRLFRFPMPNTFATVFSTHKFNVIDVFSICYPLACTTNVNPIITFLPLFTSNEMWLLFTNIFAAVLCTNKLNVIDVFSICYLVACTYLHQRGGQAVGTWHLVRTSELQHNHLRWQKQIPRSSKTAFDLWHLLKPRNSCFTAPFVFKRMKHSIFDFHSLPKLCIESGQMRQNFTRLGNLSRQLAGPCTFDPSSDGVISSFLPERLLFLWIHGTSTRIWSL